MYIDENVLKFYLDDNSNYEKLKQSKQAIGGRFEGVSNILSKAKTIKVDWKNIQEDINNYIAKVQKEFPKDSSNLDKYKSCERNFGLGRVFVVDKKLIGMTNQNDAFKKRLSEIEEDFVLKLLFVMSGYDFDTKKVVNEYRILSNKQKEYDFEGSTYSQRTCAWINSHFSDNTLFIEFVDFIKNCKEKYDGANIDRTNIALCYPGRVTDAKINNFNAVQEDYKKQQEILNFRFPYKFMWMWANADNVIHPISLDAFRNFLKSDFMQEIFKELSKDENFKKLECGLKYKDNKKDINKEEFSNFELEKYAEIITDCHFDSFPAIWQQVSDKIYSNFFQSDSDKVNNLQTLSKVISFLCIGETDMKNISDLLKAHKQIILYGVPGTGKTYSAKKVVYDWIDDENKIDKDDIKEFIKPYRFKKEDEEPSKNIVWDIVQFHPNYSYQDFIGGIAPNVKNDGSLSYTLNHGIFKKFCYCAAESLENNENKKFIFIIDEINRANLSEVFGELLYALEYRNESVSVANFDEFCIPSNVYIIGTMNNVDKSLATFDLALRRRFGFYEVGVDYGAIYNAFEESKQPNNIDSYIQRCIELNYFLSGSEDLSDYEDKKKKELEAIKLENTQDYYKIGHAYFMKIKSFMDKDEFVINPQHLEKLWIYHIEPLLMEYLGLSYDDNNIKERIGKIKEYFTKKLDEE
ncbi:McrB family protein [Campylobacter sp. RM12637]|uniref:McrB family protein n=1 Tax=Campylobacter sp. RM12637 TaxID=2735734 RepID=UPI0030143794|nr:AAA family ATPase [Campylobacter sp. RM12637]